MDHDSEQGRGRGRLRVRVAHHPLLAGGPPVATAIVAGFLGTGIWSIVALVAVAGYLTVQVLTFAHDRQLCERCLAESPDDPGHHVATHRGRLRAFHVSTTGAGLVALLVATAVGITAARLVQPGWGDLVLLLPLACTALTAAHRRVEPWCPFCGWGHGDDHDEAAAPPPDPRATVLAPT